MSTSDNEPAISFRWTVRREYRTERGPLVIEEVVPDNIEPAALIRGGPHDIRALATASIRCDVSRHSATTLEQCAAEDQHFRDTAGTN